MIARCIYNTGSALGAPVRGGFYSTQTIFHVQVGKRYIVLGLGIFESVLLGLVCDETAKPNWLPVGLFDLEDRILPDHWEFAVLDGKAASGGDASNRWVVRWGYTELVRDAGHSAALIERDPGALEIFARELRRRSADSEE